MEYYANVFYVSNFNSIGGVETYIFELARKYSAYDITVIYKTGSQEQINRIRNYVRVIKYNGEKIKCRKAFFNYETDIIDNIYSIEKKYIQLIHAMFKTQEIIPKINSKITEFFCVSEEAGKEWEELTGFKCKHVRNPLQITEEEKKPVLWLISATRLTPEKGKERMIKLANLLDNNNINYLWLVFTNDKDAIDNPNVVYMEPRLNIRPYIAGTKGKGYGVQLSDCEGDCYFTRECEGLGVPLLCTPIPSFKEQGLIDGVNCYYLPFDMKGIDINKIVNNIPSYEPYIKEDSWEKQLVKEKSTYEEEKKMKAKIRCIQEYLDLELSAKSGEKVFVTPSKEDKNYERIVTRERADFLVDLGVVEIVEIIKEEKKVTKAVRPKKKEEKAVKKTK